MGRANPYSAEPLKEALKIVEVIFSKSGGHAIPRVDLANALKLFPDSKRLRELITASSKFGLTEGSYKATSISPTPRSKLIFAPTEEGQKHAALVEAFESLPAYKQLLERYNNQNMPDAKLVYNWLAGEFKLNPSEAENCWDNFLTDLEMLGWITKTQSGDRIFRREHPKLKVSTDTKAQLPEVPEKSPDDPRLPDANLILPTRLMLNLEIHISADASEDKIEAVFKYMRQYLMDKPTKNE